MRSILGVLVAGGAGSRLALGMPKALARLGGVTLLERALATLAAVCDGIVVSAPARMDLPLPGTVPSARGARPVRRADDPAGTLGPLAGIVAGLGSVPCDCAVVLGVDLPFVEPAALEALVERLPGHQAVVPVPGGFPQPLAAAYAAAAGPILASRLAAGERSPIRALRSLDVLSLDDRELAQIPGGAAGFFNLNTPADLVESERRLAARKASA
ncbi:MAG: molybdenum cofactor guanylyltransferase [Candidatus Eiseniibacteriota bacterium]